MFVALYCMNIVSPRWLLYILVCLVALEVASAITLFYEKKAFTTIIFFAAILALLLAVPYVSTDQQLRRARHLLRLNIIGESKAQGGTLTAVAK